MRGHKAAVMLAAGASIGRVAAARVGKSGCSRAVQSSARGLVRSMSAFRPDDTSFSTVDPDKLSGHVPATLNNLVDGEVASCASASGGGTQATSRSNTIRAGVQASGR